MRSRAGARAQRIFHLPWGAVRFERMLWASNWPHPFKPPEKRSDDAALLDLLLEWAPEEATRRMILTGNPARLYGF